MCRLLPATALMWLLLMAGGVVPVNAAAGDLDPTFDPGANNFAGTLAALVQPDGKILVGGGFTVGDTNIRSGVARLNSDGSLDTEFLKTGGGVSGEVRAMVLQPGGKIVIGGNFTQVNGVPRDRIARLNADGSLDALFNASVSAAFTFAVNALALQPDGKILVGGVFTTVNGSLHPNLARLNSDGSLDPSFSGVDFGSSSSVVKILLQPDGRLIIAGGFVAVNGTPRNGLARLNADGSLDASFLSSSSGPNNSVNALALQADGKVLIGGLFTEVGGVARSRIARLNADGSLDLSFFASVTGPFFVSVDVVVVQADGNILIGGGLFGGFKAVNGTPRNQLARLKTDGSLDETFLNFAPGPGGAVTTLVFQPDGKLLVGGSYQTFNGVTRRGIARLLLDLSPNPLDLTENFVTQHYRDFLNREPDAPGLAFWTDNINKCHDPARRPANQTEEKCIDRQRETTSAAFFRSPEFQYTGYFVYRVYKGALGRAPYLSEFTPDRAIVGQGIIVNDHFQADIINQNKVSFVNQFVQRAEFKALYDGLTNQQYVDRLFQTTAVTPTQGERDALVAALNNSTETRATVLLKVVDGVTIISEGNQQFTTAYGKAFYDREYNNAFVLMEYFGYLRRDPDAPGYEHWLGKLNFYGNYIDAEMVRSFIVSPEYRARFGQP